MLLAVPPTAAAGGTLSQFKDPKDGYFDLSKRMLSRSGFVPMPLILNEPAVGVGLGFAPVFVHGENKLVDESGEMLPPEERLPPSATAGFGLLTSNDSWVLGGGHFGSWRKDRIRYTGVLALTELNLDFYVDDDPFGFAINGGLLLQDIRFRLGASNWFLGGSYFYLDSEAVFEVDSEVPGVDPTALDSLNAGLAALAYYDSRDNLFTPLKGLEMLLEGTFHRESLGGDFDYDQLDLDLKIYRPLSADEFFLSARLFAQTTDGDVPFYGLPFIRLRGVPALRYQGQRAGSLELETRWRVHRRWSVLIFGGAGKTEGTDAQDDFSDIYAGGGGFRYLLARRVGLWAGIDAARGPEEWDFYIQIGSSWR
jgi:hypothetical protein